MKKRSHSRIRGVFRKAFNFRYWSDYDRMAGWTMYLWNGFKRLFIPQKKVGKGDTVSFEQAIRKMNLTEADLQRRQISLWRLSMLMAFLAVLIFLYSFYHLYYGSFQATLLCYSVMLIAVALSFRYHFWYYQMRERKLGCSFSEWFREGLLGQKT